MKRVSIIHDSEIFCKGLISKINESGIYEVARVIHSGDALQKADLAAVGEDAFLVGAGTPGTWLSGRTILTELMENRPKVGRIIITRHNNVVLLKTLPSEAAAGFLWEYGTARRVLTALDVVLDGGSYTCPTLKGHVQAAGDTPDAESLQLTQRQFDVLLALGRGLDNGDMANELGLSVSTVVSHMAELKRRLGLQTTRQLMYFTWSNGLSFP